MGIKVSEPGLSFCLLTLLTLVVLTFEKELLPKRNQSDRSPETSLQVTLGSEDLSDYEILPTKGGPVSEVPAVQLPCYFFESHHLPGECYGRTDILQTLDEVLLPPPAYSVSSSQMNHPRAFALCGPGGIGKTQIAMEFAMTRKKAFDAVFWVHSDSEIKISGDYTLIAAKLGLMHELDQGNAVISRDRFIEWLNRPSKHGRCVNNENSEYLESAANWLLIFDNADNPEILAEYWPATGKGSVLVTSRDPMAKTHFFLTSGVDLEPFDRESAATFLQALTGYQTETDHEEALVLVDRLGGLPLALAQFASVLQRQDLSFAEFLEAYNDPLFLADVHSAVVSGLRGKNKRALFSVWQFESLSLVAQQLLDLIAMADPDAIPEIVFLHAELTHLSKDFPTSLREFESARTGLLRCSLVRRLKTDKAIRIHRVIRDAARARMTPERFALAFKAFSELLHASRPSEASNMTHETKHWTLSAKLMPHIEELRKTYLLQDRSSKQNFATSQYASLLIEAAWYVYFGTRANLDTELTLSTRYNMERGNHLDMLPLLECAESVILAVGLKSSMLMALCHLCFSASLTWLRRPDKARYHCEENIRLSLLIDDDFNLSKAFTEMGVYFLTANQYEEALDALKRSIDIQAALLQRETDSEVIKSGLYMATFPKCYSAYALLGLERADDAERHLVPLLDWYKNEWGLTSTRSYK